MKRKQEKLIELVCHNRDLIIYTLASMMTTGIDIALSYILEFILPKLVSNAIGSITGFTIHYLIVTSKVFKNRSTRTFIIFVSTFIIGLILAEAIIWLLRDIVFGGADSIIAFLVSKAASLILPFFVSYFIRAKLIRPEEKTI